MTNFQDRANFIWNLANLLRGDYKPAEYGKAVLPVTIVIRALVPKKVVTPSRPFLTKNLPVIRFLHGTMRVGQFQHPPTHRAGLPYEKEFELAEKMREERKIELCMYHKSLTH